MANLIKSANGLLFNDDFSVKTLMWTLSPSDMASVLEFGAKGLRIKHSDTYVTYTIVEPELNEYCLITKLDHQLVDYNDIAGVIVFSSNKQYAECQTYLADEPSPITNTYYALDFSRIIVSGFGFYPGNMVLYSFNDGEYLPATIYYEMEDPSEDPGIHVETEYNPEWQDQVYPWIKMYKTLNTYIFYASIDGYNWIEVGNVRYENCGEIGLFQYAAKDVNNTIDDKLLENSHCYFEYFTLYTSKYLTILGIDKDVYDFELVDTNGHVLCRTDDSNFQYIINWHNKTCIINTTVFPMPVTTMSMHLYKKGEYAMHDTVFEMGHVYGGDAYSYEQNIKLFVENVEVDPDKLYNLGEFYSGNYFIRLEVHNFDDDIAYNKTVKVIRYSEYYNGEEEIYLANADALQEGQMPYQLEYKKEIFLDEIQPSGGRNLYMRLTDKPVQDFFMTANDFRFKIIIE